MYPYFDWKFGICFYLSVTFVSYFANKGHDKENDRGRNPKAAEKFFKEVPPN